MTNVFVNGALIDQSYLEENVKEAREYAWKKSVLVEGMSHAHCIICSVPLPDDRWDYFYRAKDVYLCPSCYVEFVSKP